MEKQRLSAFNSQLSRIYCLAIIHIILSAIGAIFNCCTLNSWFVYCAILIMNILAITVVVYLEPWKIMGYLNEGYGYKQGLNTIAQEKGIKND